MTGRATGLEHPKSLLDKKPGVVQMLNDLGTEYHVEFVVLKRPAPVQVAIESFNAARFRPGL